MDVTLALAVRSLVRATERFRAFHAREILGVSGSDFIALGTIYTVGACTPTEIARELGISTASVTELVDRLVRAGWVQRRRHAVDRRKVEVILTPQGTRNVERLYGHFDRALSGALELSDTDRTRVVAMMNDCAEALGAPSPPGSDPAWITQDTPDGPNI